MPRFDYPRYDLENAIDLAKAVLKMGGNAKVGSIAHSLKMAESGGAFNMKLSAAKAFGLIDGKEDVLLTSLAKKYLQPIDSREENVALREMLLSPPLCNKLYERFVAKGMHFPDTKSLANMLAREYDVPVKSSGHVALTLISSFKYANAAISNSLVINESSRGEEKSSSNNLDQNTGNVVKISIKGVYDGSINIENSEDWDLVESVIKSLRIKWETGKKA